MIALALAGLRARRPAAARGRGVLAASLVVGTGDDGRLRAGDRASTARPREADLPDVDRALRPRAPLARSTRACARCRTSRRAPTGCELTDVRMRRRARPLSAPRRRSSRARRPARLRDHRAGTTSPAAGRGRGRARAGARVGPAARATGCASAGFGDLRVVGDRARRPTTSRSRSPRAARVYVGEHECATRSASARRPTRTSRCCGCTTRRAPTSRSRRRASVLVRARARCSSSRATGVRVLLVAGGGDRDLAARRVLARRAARGGDDARGGRARRRAAAAGGDRRPARARLHARRGSPRVQAARGGAGRRCPRRRPGIAVGRARGRRAGGVAARARSTSSRPGAALRRRRCSPRLAVVVALVVAAATWPAWRAARRPPAAILRGGDLAARGAARGGAGGGLRRRSARASRSAARGRWRRLGADDRACARASCC